MNETALLQNYLFVGAILFALGTTGFLCRRNMIVMFLAVEMMLQGVSLSLVAWSRFHNDWDGQVLVIFIIAVAACEAAIALALVLMLARSVGSLDVSLWQTLRDDSQPPFVDHELPEDVDVDKKEWPHLVPAGVEPEHDVEETVHRPRV